MAILKKKTVNQVKNKKSLMTPASLMTLKWFPRPCSTAIMARTCVSKANVYRDIPRKVNTSNNTDEGTTDEKACAITYPCGNCPYQGGRTELVDTEADVNAHENKNRRDGC